uniref:Uncharacterized protein n=1 Tax=Anopheles epiroticus TaxID=199890 RepID=A0A182PCY8_9DIPT
MESLEICRVCMEEVQNVWPLFDDCTKVPPNLTPASLISECAGVEIVSNDGLPEMVCDSCLEAMVGAYTIRRKCISSDRKLRKLLLCSMAYVVPKIEKHSKNLTDANASQRRRHSETNDVDAIAENEESTGGSHDGACSEKQNEDSVVSKVSVEEGPELFDEEYLMEYVKDQQQEDVHEDKPFISVDTELETVQHNTADISTVESIQIVEYQETEYASPKEKPFICDICSKRFTTNGNLKAHVLLHTNHRPFGCELCGATFSKKHNFNLHKQRHIGERSHPCPVCEKSFVCAVNLKNHMVIHSFVKPFQCVYCGKEFSFRTDKIRHEITHTGNYRYRCEKCQRTYSRNSDLAKHLVKCNGERLKTNHRAPKRTPKAEHTEQ